MKKRWKAFAVVCASLAGIGVLLCAAGIAVGATDENVRAALRRGVGIIKRDVAMETDLDPDIKEQYISSDEGVIFKGVRNIELEVTRVEAKIVETDEPNIRVEADVLNELKFRCYQEEDTLKIVTMKNNHFRINHGGTVIIYVPAGMKFGEADLSIGAGSLNINALTAEELELHVGAGAISAFGIQAGDLSVDCGAGAIDLEGIITKDAEIECGMGRVGFSLEGSEEDYSYDLDVGMGAVTIGGGTFGGMAMEKTVNNNSSRHMEIECGMGEVDIAFTK